jgi:hypothetical protein
MLYVRNGPAINGEKEMEKERFKICPEDAEATVPIQ